MSKWKAKQITKYRARLERGQGLTIIKVDYKAITIMMSIINKWRSRWVHSCRMVFLTECGSSQDQVMNKRKLGSARPRIHQNKQ
jgi:hypothetical protein